MNERCLELIHAEIDDALSPQDRAELNRHLLADPQTRCQRDELASTCRLLDGIEPVREPADFTHTLMSRLDASGVLPVASLQRRFWHYPLARYAAAFGAGLLVTAFVPGGSGTGTDPDFTRLAGTMAAPAESATKASGLMRIDTPELTGEVRLVHSENGRLSMLEFRLQSAAAFEVVAEFNGRSARFHQTGDNAGHFGVVLDEPTGDVKVQLEQSGRVVYQGVLHDARQQG